MFLFSGKPFHPAILPSAEGSVVGASFCDLPVGGCARAADLSAYLRKSHIYHYIRTLCGVPAMPIIRMTVNESGKKLGSGPARGSWGPRAGKRRADGRDGARWRS